MAASVSWTADMVRALPDDGNRYEVVDGELLVTPSPTYRHQRAAMQLSIILFDYVRAHRVGEVVLSPADIELDTHGLVQPDVFVQERPAVRRDAITWQPSAGAEPLHLDLPSLFARIHGEAL